MDLTLTLPASALQPLLPALLRHAADALAEQSTAPFIAGTLTATTDEPPRIGEHWSSQGGIYAGTCRGIDGSPDHHLILCEAKPDDTLNWQAALDWAGALSAAGHSDWFLPTRAESSVLFGNLRDQFDPAWHWTSEQYSAHGAWLQYFVDGYQLSGDKGNEGRARAVRRVKLNP
jgi:hypothetical protein